MYKWTKRAQRSAKVEGEKLRVRENDVGDERFGGPGGAVPGSIDNLCVCKRVGKCTRSGTAVAAALTGAAEPREIERERDKTRRDDTRRDETRRNETRRVVVGYGTGWSKRRQKWNVERITAAAAAEQRKMLTRKLLYE